MRIEIPEPKRCCFCLPLRRGLVFWIYSKLALGVIGLLYLIAVLISIPSKFQDWFLCTVLSVGLTISVMEIIFSILFLISAHRKSHEYMRIYYRYAIGILILEVAVMLFFVGLGVYIAFLSTEIFIMFIYEIAVKCDCLVFVQIVLQAYLIILVRSEVLKLERSTRAFQFINHTIESECKAQILMSYNL